MTALPKTVWFTVVYRDYPGGPIYEFSRHRTYDAAAKAYAKALDDPFWSGYDFGILSPRAEQEA